MGVVLTAKLEDSLRFYRDALGMAVAEEWSEFGHGALLSAGPQAQIELIAAEVEEIAPEQHTVFIGLEVDDVDTWYQRVVDFGAPVKSPPRELAWGPRGFTTFDPNGMPINIYTYPAS